MIMPLALLINIPFPNAQYTITISFIAHQNNHHQNHYSQWFKATIRPLFNNQVLIHNYLLTEVLM